MSELSDLSEELFAPVSREEREGVPSAREPAGYWQGIRKRFLANRAAAFSACFLLAVLLLAVIGPMLSPFRYGQQVKGMENLPPFVNAAHPLGTAGLGRDELVRLLFGARVSLAIGVAASFLVCVIGVLYGSVAGYFGGIVDGIMMRLVDILYAVPSLLVIILLSVVLRAPLTALFDAHRGLQVLQALGPGLLSIFIAFTLLCWTDMARMVRGQVLSIRESAYVRAAKALGAGPGWIIFKHLIPNSMGVILVTATFNIPTAIFTEAFLSFLGLGVSPPMCSLGSLASDALGGIYSYPCLLVFPCVLISLMILAFNLLGDGLRDAFDPHGKGGR